MLKKFGLGILGLSYSYGFCRGWTLPIWSDTKKSSFREYIMRTSMSVGLGFAYIIPPLCFVKYLHMYGRFYEHKHGMKKYGEIWREWGFYHPRTF
jgi:hypothetical protein